jgi:hypothetical protein
MSAWDLASFVAFAAAGIPPVYFALTLRAVNRPFSRLSLLLAGALFAHSTFHLLRTLEAARPGTLAIETASAVLTLTFALAYWPLRGRDSRDP